MMQPDLVAHARSNLDERRSEAERGRLAALARTARVACPAAGSLASRIRDPLTVLRRLTGARS